MANGTLFFSKEWKEVAGKKAVELSNILEQLMDKQFGIKCNFAIAASSLGGKDVSVNLYDVGALDPQVATDLMYELRDAAVQFSWKNGKMIDQDEVIVSLSNSTLVV